MSVENETKTPAEQRYDEGRDQRQAMSGLSAGYTLLGAIGVGLMIGFSIDRVADTSPVWTAIMAVLFIVVGLYQVVKEHWPS